MHAGFISLKTFDGICKSFTSLIQNKDDKFTDNDVEIIRVHCLEAVQQKWADKAKIKNENHQPQLENAFKPVEAIEDELIGSLKEDGDLDYVEPIEI